MLSWSMHESFLKVQTYLYIMMSYYVQLYGGNLFLAFLVPIFILVQFSEMWKKQNNVPLLDNKVYIIIIEKKIALNFLCFLKKNTWKQFILSFAGTVLNLAKIIFKENLENKQFLWLHLCVMCTDF